MPTDATPTDLTRALTVALTDTRVIVSRAAIERLAERLAELLESYPPTTTEEN